MNVTITTYTISKNMEIKTKNPREAAFLILLSVAKEESFIQDLIYQWRSKNQPSPQDFDLASEIAYGTTRMTLACDYIAGIISNKKPNKMRERILLRLAIYQFYFTRIPIYAIVNETIEIAKKYCHYTFVNYLNALLRKLEKEKPSLPQDNLSVYYSYPQFFVDNLIKDYDVETAKTILTIGNLPAPIIYRNRKNNSYEILSDKTKLSEITNSTNYYIQNSTPGNLMMEMAKKIKPPQNILDLCAAPGGKLLLAHDLFPNATLFANDITPEKVQLLSENCKKYRLDVNLSCQLGEHYESSQKFDLIILDVPCSNTGVLNKRTEARWRLNEANLKQLEELQLKLLNHAKTLLSPNGAIFYLTCSILKQENENLVRKSDFNIIFEKTILPNKEEDGGYCALLI